MRLQRWLAGVVSVAALAVAQPAAAHCDSMDGPVVKAAQRALSTGRVEHVLMWVQPAGEAEIRTAFERTLAARAAGKAAAEVADLWFFETVVRVHRAGEGEPYTGLKPAGYEPDAGIAAADASLERGSIEAFAQTAAQELRAALSARFERVRALAHHDAADVKGGREYVDAYVAYIHFVEAVHGLLHETDETHATPNKAEHGRGPGAHGLDH